MTDIPGRGMIGIRQTSRGWIVLTHEETRGRWSFYCEDLTEVIDALIAFRLEIDIDYQIEDLDQQLGGDDGANGKL